MEPVPPSPEERTQPRWQPLAALERRVLGVLIEKAKTTPDAYPMSINGICTACNQKNNRYPLMQVELEDVEPALDRLRQLGAVAFVEGSGRVQKYRHYAKDWLGVEKTELAVMAELLLRGAQTEGELRGRAARMEPLADVAALRPVLASLAAKGLIVSLTPEGRGHVLTHNLYEPRELERLRRDHSAQAAGEHQPSPPVRPTIAAPGVPVAADNVPPLVDEIHQAHELAASARDELQRMREELQALRMELAELAEQVRRNEDEISQLRQALGG